MTKEQWRSLPEGFDTEYEVSTLGRVRRGDRLLNPYPLTRSRIRASNCKSTGFYLRMHCDGRRPYCAVADLVLLAHVPDFDPAKHVVVFLDNDTANHTLANLSFVPKEFKTIRKRIHALRSLAG